jgi:hypothetical protein
MENRRIMNQHVGTNQHVDSAMAIRWSNSRAASKRQWQTPTKTHERPGTGEHPGGIRSDGTPDSYNIVGLVICTSQLCTFYDCSYRSPAMLAASE